MRYSDVSVIVSRSTVASQGARGHTLDCHGEVEALVRIRTVHPAEVPTRPVDGIRGHRGRIFRATRHGREPLRLLQGGERPRYARDRPPRPPAAGRSTTR